MLKDQAAEIKAEVQADYAQRLGQERAQALKSVDQMLLRLKAVETVLTNHSDADATIRNIHLLFLATQELTSRIGSKQPLKNQVMNVNALEWMVSRDDLLSKAGRTDFAVK